MIIAVDFDGTIHDWEHPVPGRKMGPPMPGAKEALDLFRFTGHTIVIFTVRGGEPKHVGEWMDYFAIPYDQITATKIPADWYIDDRAIHFTNWKEATLRVAKNDPEARILSEMPTL